MEKMRKNLLDDQKFSFTMHHIVYASIKYAMKACNRMYMYVSISVHMIILIKFKFTSARDGSLQRICF